MILFDDVLYATLALLGYLVAPAMLAWGWVQWIRSRPGSWTIQSALSFTGITLASASALLGLWVIAFVNSGPPEYTINYSLLSWSVPGGAALSLAALAFALGGVRQRSPIRWQAPAGAVGTLAFWLLAAVS